MAPTATGKQRRDGRDDRELGVKSTREACTMQGFIEATLQDTGRRVAAAMYLSTVVAAGWRRYLSLITIEGLRAEPDAPFKRHRALSEAVLDRLGRAARVARGFSA